MPFKVILGTINWKLMLQFLGIAIVMYVVVRFVLHNFVGIAVGAGGMWWLANRYHARAREREEQSREDLQAWYEEYYLPNPQYFQDEGGYPAYEGYERYPAAIPGHYANEPGNSGQQAAYGLPTGDYGDEQGYPVHPGDPGYDEQSGYGQQGPGYTGRGFGHEDYPAGDGRRRRRGRGRRGEGR